MMKNTVIKVDNVSKKFNIYKSNKQRIIRVLKGKAAEDVKYALKDVSLELQKGDRVAIFGVLEAGRTTLAKIIAGIMVPSKGTVETNGRMNVMLDPKVGMEMEFTCRDNIYMKANVVGLTKAEVKKHEDEILEFAELTSYADLPLKQAPKGSATLLSIAVHLLYDSDIYVIDEVFGGGGRRITIKGMDKVIAFLRSNREKTAVIFTNNPDLAEQSYCNRAITLDNGEIVYDGDISGAKDKYQKINSLKNNG